LKIGNKNCSLQPLIGRAFGTVFQVDTAPGGPCLSPAQGSLMFLFIYLLLAIPILSEVLFVIVVHSLLIK